MCDSWRLPRTRELSVPEVERVFRKLGQLDVVRLTGGEPFLRADLADVADTVLRVSAPLVLHVTTNGSFPERVEAFARAFSEPSRLRILVSFDGLAEEHDRNRGRAVTFERALDTVRRLLPERQRGVQVSVNHTVISQRSLQDHDALRAQFERLGVDVQCVLAYADSGMYGLERRGQRSPDLAPGAGYPLHPNLQGSDVQGFVAAQLGRVDSLRDRSSRLAKRYYLRGLAARLNASPRATPRPACVALRSHLRLLPNGDVPVCQFNTRVIGNLLTQSFDEVWLNAGAREERAWVDACSGCWAECEVVPSALYSGDFLLDAGKRAVAVHE
jgi:MoaA/NifB/PqqE/SkfB family radical SAM enzyme